MLSDFFTLHSLTDDCTSHNPKTMGKKPLTVYICVLGMLSG